MLVCITQSIFHPKNIKAISQREESDNESPKPKGMKQHSKQNKYVQILIMHRGLVSLHYKKRPCPTYCLHLTTSDGPVCPVYRQALSDGKTGFERAFQCYLFTNISSHTSTGFNFQGKGTAGTWWNKHKRQGLVSCQEWWCPKGTDACAGQAA